jgi:6-phosphogluconolactonase
MVELEKDYTFLVGSYSDLDSLAHQPAAPVPGRGLYVLAIDRAGKLSLNAVYESQNPAVLVPHSNGKTVYAVLESIQDEGEVIRYQLEPSGSLKYCETFRASGRSTCYLALAPLKNAAIIINYWDAIIDVCEVYESGQLGALTQSFRQHCRPDGEWRQVTSREDHWAHRQAGPHAHCAHFWCHWVFIPDLGENAVFQYRWDADSKTLVPETHISFEAGSGPRHMALHPTLDVCYVSNELFNTVCVAQLDRSEPTKVKARLIPIQYEPTIETPGTVSHVSEIKLSPDARFLYVSNRGDDSLTMFRVMADGRLERGRIISTGGKIPRHFDITPCGRAIVVANQDSGHIRVFARSPETGELKSTEEIQEIPAPNYVRFINSESLI